MWAYQADALDLIHCQCREYFDYIDYIDERGWPHYPGRARRFAAQKDVNVLDPGSWKRVSCVWFAVLLCACSSDPNPGPGESLRAGSSLVDLDDPIVAVNHPEGAGAYLTWYDATNDAFATPSSTVVDGAPALRIDDGGYTNGVYTIIPSAIPATGTYTVEVTMQVVEDGAGTFDAIDAYQVGVSVGDAATHRGPNPSDLSPADFVGSYIGLTDGNDTAAGVQVVSTPSFEAQAGDDVRIAFSTDVSSGDWALASGGWSGAYVLVTSIELVPAESDGVVVLDNDEGPPAFESDPGWILSGGVGFDGGTYLYASTGQAAEASWRAEVEPGYYDVQTVYRAGSNRAHAAAFRVELDGELVATKSLDQRYGDLAWKQLGLVEVQTAGELVVTLSAEESSPAGTVAIADAVRLVPSEGPPPVDPPEMRIAAITVFDEIDEVGAIQANVDELAALHYNAIAVHTRYRGDATYFPNLSNDDYPNMEPRSPLAGDVDVLQEYVTRGHAAGLQVFAYVNTHLVTDGTDVMASSEHVVNTHPEWRTWAYHGGSPIVQTTLEDEEGLWLEPALPEVRSYLVDLVSDIAVNYDVDGVMLDRIRYPQTSFVRTNADFGYHPDAIAAFNDDYGKSGIPDPYDPDWIEFRQNAIMGTVGAIYDRLDELGPQLKLLAYPIGRFSDAVNYNYQNWPEWLRERRIDAVLPQIYTADLGSFSQRVTEHAEAYGGDRLLGVTLNGFSEGIELASEIEVARSSGLDGSSPFRHGTLGGLGYFEDLELAWDGIAAFPDMPWKGADIHRLRLRGVCSETPDETRRWRIQNPNGWAIETTLWVLGTTQHQTYFAPPGNSYIETSAEPGLNIGVASWYDHEDRLKVSVHIAFGWLC